MTTKRRRRLRPRTRIEGQYRFDRIYSLLPSTSPELSEPETHATIEVNNTSASDPHKFAREHNISSSETQNSTSGTTRSSLTSQYLTAEEEAKHNMASYRSPTDDSSASAHSEVKCLAASLTADLVHVYVGAKRKKYSVHSSLLLSQCPWLDGSEMWSSEGADGVSLNLKDEPVEAVELFLEWLYRGSIRPMSAETTFFGDCGHGELYLLACKWRMEIIRNVVVDSLLDWCREYDGRIAHKGIRIIFHQAPASSPLRHFVIRQTAHFLSTSDWAADESEWRKLIDIGGDFGFEVMKVLRDPSRKKIKGPGDQPNCDFHSHVDGNRCDGKK